MVALSVRSTSVPLPSHAPPSKIAVEGVAARIVTLPEGIDAHSG